MTQDQNIKMPKKLIAWLVGSVALATGLLLAIGSNHAQMQVNATEIVRVEAKADKNRQMSRDDIAEVRKDLTEFRKENNDSHYEIIRLLKGDK